MLRMKFRNHMAEGSFPMLYFTFLIAHLPYLVPRPYLSFRTSRE